jgi:hypothetical protein
MAAFSAGAVRDRSAETLGEGGTTESSLTLARDCSRVMLSGAGATTLAGRVSGLSDERKPSAGGGPGLDLKASRLATAAVEEGRLRLGASTIRWASELPRATRMVCVR